MKRQDRKSTRLNSSHSLHDALPIYHRAIPDGEIPRLIPANNFQLDTPVLSLSTAATLLYEKARSEEHTSELQSLPTRRSSDLSQGDSRWRNPPADSCQQFSVGHARSEPLHRGHPAL